MKILIIRFSSIGDIVLTSPVTRCIRKQLPSAEIHYLTKKAYREIIDYNPYIDVRHYLDDNWKETISLLKKERFDYVVDLHNNVKSWRVRKALHRKGNIVNKINFEKWFYVNLRWNIMPVSHIVDRYLDTARPLGVYPDGEGLDYFISPKDEVRVEDLPLTHIHGYIALVIGAKHQTKKLPVTKLQTLARQLHFPIILLGGPEDREAGEVIRHEDTLKIFNGCGLFSLNQSASIIRQASVVITHDTGLMHIAAAYKKRIISIWGNTVPEFGMYPYFGKGETSSQVVEIRGLSCRPCSKLGFEKCPKGHFKCMNEIDEKKIASLVVSGEW